MSEIDINNNVQQVKKTLLENLWKTFFCYIYIYKK
jgi:hypothetical protein